MRRRYMRPAVVGEIEVKLTDPFGTLKKSKGHLVTYEFVSTMVLAWEINERRLGWMVEHQGETVH